MTASHTKGYTDNLWYYFDMTGKSDGGWPAITTEARPWVRSGDEVASRRALMRARGDYEAAVPAHLARIHVSLAPEVLAMADDASRELTRFDSEIGAITAPFASILLRTESASSSEVENLTSSAKQVALAEIGASGSGNAKLVVANARAMVAALELADHFGVDAIIAMQEALLGESAPHFAGQFRSQQVWIGGGSLSPHAAAFVPPHYERVPELMDDLVEFANRTDVPVLAHAALTHAQFETIHPFSDGNGRTGRALLHSMLRRGGITQNVTVPVSAGLLRDTHAYFDALTAFREGDAGAIVEAVSEAAFLAIRNGRGLVSDLGNVRASWKERVVARTGSAAARLGNVLLRQPVVSAKVVAKELKVSEVAAQGAIDRFMTAGALVSTNNWKRNRIWHAPEVLEALDQFGERSRRSRV